MTSEAQTIAANATFWEETYTRHFQKLTTRASRKLTRGRIAEAEDIVSDALLKVMLTKDNPTEITHPLQYLWTAVRHAWFSQQARLKAASTAQLEDLTMKTLEKIPSLQLEPKVLEALDREDTRNAMLCRFGPMSTQERTMVEMRLDGCSFIEIADELGESLKTTRLRWRNMITRQRTRGWANRRKPAQE
jgi:DNA-directed RNA polymerase specialized sigma24 family protein